MCRVLLVEDEELERLYLKKLLEKQNTGYSVIGEARNGKEAIELAKDFLPDIIFMDLKMPGIDGLTATQVIKEFNPRVKIIILTAYDEFKYAQQALRLGASEYLVKPAQPKEILAALELVSRSNQKDLLNITDTFPETKDDFISTNYPLDKEKTLIKALQQNDLKFFISTLDEYTKQLLCSSKKIATLKIRLFELITIISRTLYDSSFDSAEIGQFKARNFQAISAIPSVNEVQYFIESLPTAITNITPLTEVSGKELIKKVLNYINTNLTKDISLEDIAQKFHFSSCHLSRLIKKATSLTYPEYLNQIRLSEAKILLRNSNLNVSKIAQEVGYHEVSHFNRVFKKAIGLSPTKYRKLFSDEKKEQLKNMGNAV